jgi:hypothetical protein
MPPDAAVEEQEDNETTPPTEKQAALDWTMKRVGRAQRQAETARAETLRERERAEAAEKRLKEIEPEVATVAELRRSLAATQETLALAFAGIDANSDDPAIKTAVKRIRGAYRDDMEETEEKKRIPFAEWLRTDAGKAELASRKAPTERREAEPAAERTADRQEQAPRQQQAPAVERRPPPEVRPAPPGGPISAEEAGRQVATLLEERAATKPGSQERKAVDAKMEALKEKMKARA